MASFVPTSTVQLQRFASAVYGLQIGSTTLAAVQADIQAVGGIANALNAYYAASFGSTSAADVAKIMVANFGITDAAAVTEATAYIKGQIEGAPAATRGSVVSSIASLFSGLTADAKYGTAATAYAAKIAAAMNYTGSDDQTFGTTVPVAGKVFTLLAGVDTFVGAAGDDTFNAPAGTFTALDNLNGDGGNDSLNISATAAFTTPTGVKVAGIENINVSSSAAVTIDTSGSGFTGVNSLSVATSTAAATVTAATTTNITVTDNAAGANNAITVDGGKDVSITATGSTLTTETIGVGATTAPKGVVTISQTTATTNAAGSTVTTKGGSSVVIDQVIKNTATTNTATNGAVSVTGTADTKSVTVTQSAPVTATAATAAAAGVNNAVVAVGGVASSAVTIADLNAGSPTLPGSIAAVTLKNYAASTISSSALNTLTLSGTGVNTAGRAIATGTLGLTDGLATPTEKTLTLNLGGGTLGVITDSSAKFTTMNAVMSADTTFGNNTFAALKTLNISGKGVLTTGTVPATVTSITVADAAGMSGTLPASVLSFDASTSTSKETVTLTNSNLQSYKGGSGIDTVRITSDATKSIDGGAGTADVLELGAITSTATYFTAANAGANVKNFEIFATSASTSGTVDLATFATNNTFSTVKFKSTGNVTLNNVPKGAAVEVSSATTAPATPAAAGTYTVNYIDYTGWTDSASVKLNGAAAVNGAGNAYLGTGTVGYTTTGLTLQDAAGTGVSTVTFDSNGTVAGSLHTITTLTDTYLANLTIGGTAGLTITNLTVSSPSLTITDNDTSTGASGITTLTAASLANLSYSGTKAFSTAIAGDNAAAVTISNANVGTTGVLTIGTSALDLATKITLIGSVAATLTSTQTAAQKLTAGTDNSNISFSNTAGTAVKTIVAGNGDNTITTGGGADVITLGSGANTVTPGAGADTITFDVAHTGVDKVVYAAAADSAAGNVSNGATVISTATGFDIIYGMHAGDKLDFAAVDANIATANLDGTLNAAVAAHADIVRGNWNTLTGYFTTSTTGADTLVQYNNGAAVESVLLVGIAATAAGSTATAGVITLG